MTLDAHMSRQEMASAMSSLNQALYMHERWSEAIHRALICQLAPEPRDLSSRAYRECPFGRWYYGSQNLKLARHPGFVAIAGEHEKMHESVRRILSASQAGERIAVSDYENFVKYMTRMRLEIVNLNRELEEDLTSLDPLTDALSRFGMLTILRRQLELVKRDVMTCTIAMMDLDLFKAINDNYGHQAGDRVLIEVVRYIRSRLRPYDEFFRYGGEEFLLCTPIEVAKGYHTIERIREGIAALPIDVGEASEVRITISVGLATLDPDVPVEQSIARADRALYVSKAAGRNRTTLWDESMG